MPDDEFQNATPRILETLQLPVNDCLAQRRSLLLRYAIDVIDRPYHLPVMIDLKGSMENPIDKRLGDGDFT
jgi:hypothetical protein